MRTGQAIRSTPRCPARSVAQPRFGCTGSESTGLGQGLVWGTAAVVIGRRSWKRDSARVALLGRWTVRDPPPVAVCSPANALRTIDHRPGRRRAAPPRAVPMVWWSCPRLLYFVRLLACSVLSSAGTQATTKACTWRGSISGHSGRRPPPCDRPGIHLIQV